MRTKKGQILQLLLLVFCTGLFMEAAGFSRETPSRQDLDRRVRDFLESSRWGWRDMNVPAVDGEKLYEIIVKNKYKKALEIGTSTGHSTIWIAWAMSKTGGKLITIEINERRYNEALANLEKAGLTEYVDARLADAHELVPDLPGPFDFVFCDADKDWYTNYFKDVLPKLEAGGCFTAHNVSPGRYGGRRRRGGTGAFVAYLEGVADIETTFFMEGGGLSISYKKK
jgi:predicted O-methyltransferase YrrM